MPPLILMLGQGDVQLKEMAAFALGRLAQNADNQAGVVEVPPPSPSPPPRPAPPLPTPLCSVSFCDWASTPPPLLRTSVGLNCRVFSGVAETIVLIKVLLQQIISL